MTDMDIVERFLRYTRINTTAKPGATTLPSSENQWKLAQLLATEMRGLGLNVEERDHAIVIGTLAANSTTPKPVIAFVCHMDTSSEYNTDTYAQIVDYQGGDITLNSQKNIIMKAAEFPELAAYIGDSLIVTDGTSLLGADNKSAIAEVMHALAVLAHNPAIEHGTVKVVFVPDEEIGLLGAKALDAASLEADFAYTLDCCAIGEIVYENWNAGEFEITFHGVAAHPMSAKGQLRNSLLYANQFINQLPGGERPEYTQGREGYYWVKAITGSAAQTVIHVDIRDFSTHGYEKRRRFVETLADTFNALYGAGTAEIRYKPVYRNVAGALQNGKAYPVQLALDVMRDMGLTITPKPMRGGYDGTILTEKGLPCPNLFCGAHNFHSIHEFLPVNSLKKAADMVVEIIKRAEKV
ncbi:MAG: Peptidase T [Candidatus Tokpelaia hoelldobleri]|uniref:Peptidase T n=1 Tax=Candidatus Tokpelaia hoelldobleri TaxID=1902579 RepID=A0A1U9JTF6_9HYPH|nr:MAG: Peptidase T [Candidatus Tokpelaia hoelldoblerii]